MKDTCPICGYEDCVCGYSDEDDFESDNSGSDDEVYSIWDEDDEEEE